MAPDRPIAKATQAKQRHPAQIAQTGLDRHGLALERPWIQAVGNQIERRNVLAIDREARNTA